MTTFDYRMHSTTDSQRWLFTVCHNPSVSRNSTEKTPTIFAIFLIVAGLVGLYASFQLTLEKLSQLEFPNKPLSCDFGLFVTCGPNLSSAQGSILGFPNSLMGVAAFVAPIAVGVGLLAGARFARWFWVVFNVGVLGAFVFIGWLISQSLFVIGTLCPYCLVTWLAVIPLFWTVTFFTLKNGYLIDSAAARNFGRHAYSWVISITIVTYLILAILIQVGLDAIQRLF